MPTSRDTIPAGLPPYAALILGPNGEPVGTCFQLTPGLFVSAEHNLVGVPEQDPKPSISIRRFGAHGSLEATILLRDATLDLVLLQSDDKLPDAVPYLKRTRELELGEHVLLGGLATSVTGDLEFNQLTATGTWQGEAARDDGLKFGRIESTAVMKGMSGCPVRTADGAVIGILSSRFNSGDGWLQHTAWIITSEQLIDVATKLLGPAFSESIAITRSDKNGRVASRKSSERREVMVSRVRETLELQGHGVTPPKKVTWAKPLHLIAAVSFVGRHRSIGIHCHVASEAPNFQALSRIHDGAREALSARHIDELLIITECETSLDVSEWEKSHLGSSIQSMRSFLRSSIDLLPYVRQVSQVFQDAPDGLADCYVSPRAPSGSDLEDEVVKWIVDSPESEFPLDKPLAILGSYGLGKTTFALRLTADLARLHMRDPASRIPILISLGDLATQQDLEGLVGKLFTASHMTPGFSFPLFKEMNRRGHFVIILDGFDEMKHLLTWSEFKFNLRQLGRLVEGSSKVLLLGRPTAFETDAEINEALHGRMSGPMILPVPNGTPDFHEVELGPLEAHQVREFLKNYGKYAARSGRPFDFECVWTQVKSKRLKDIAQRPVQLKMLAEILPHYTGSLDELDLVTLYDTFVDQLITQVLDRETSEKASRIAYGREERRVFLARLAFWMWEQPANRLITSDQVPDELITPFCRGLDINQVRRDLVVASPLDRRAGERIRFAHRSFQEFLVAEEAWRRLSGGELTVEHFDEVAGDEVAAFVRLLRRPKHGPIVRRALQDLNGSLSWRTVHGILTEESAIQNMIQEFGSIETSPIFSPWEILATCVEAIDAGREPGIDHRVMRALSRSQHDPNVLLVLCFIACAAQPKNDVTQENRAQVADGMLRALLTSSTSRETILASEFRSVKGRPRRRVEADDEPHRQGRRPPRELRRAQEYQFADNRAPYEPIGQKYLGDARGTSRRLGRYQSKPFIFWKDERRTRDGLAIQGGSKAEVAWLPQSAVHLARTVAGVEQLDTRRLAGFFAEELSKVAFVTNWVQADAVRTSILHSWKLSLTEETTSMVREISKASMELGGLSDLGMES